MSYVWVRCKPKEKCEIHKEFLTFTLDPNDKWTYTDTCDGGVIIQRSVFRLKLSKSEFDSLFEDVEEWVIELKEKAREFNEQFTKI